MQKKDEKFKLPHEVSIIN